MPRHASAPPIAVLPRDQSSAQRNVGFAIVPRYTINWSPSIQRSRLSKSDEVESDMESTVPAGTSAGAV